MSNTLVDDCTMVSPRDVHQISNKLLEIWQHAIEFIEMQAITKVLGREPLRIWNRFLEVNTQPRKETCTIDFGANIEDSYALVLKYPGMVGTLIVDVAARYAVRNLVLNMEKGQIQWKWDDACVNLYEVENNRWVKFNQPEFSSASGYNKNIGEQMYIDEINAFINYFKGVKAFPNTIDDDIKVLEILNNVENSDGGF